MSESKRFSLLEIDDTPEDPKLPKGYHSAKAAEEVRQREAAARDEEVSRARELARIKEREVEAERERLELAERRSRSMIDATERRRAMRKKRVVTKGAKDRVNDKLHAIGKKYHPDLGIILEEIFDLLAGEGFEVNGHPRSSSESTGTKRNVYDVQDEDGVDYALVITNYQMPKSGNYEIVSYLS